MAPKNFTQRDMDLMAAAFQSLKTPPEIDYNKLAEKAGYKNAATARVCFMDTKKKLFANDGDAAGPAVSKKRAPAKSNKRKQPTPDDSSPTLAGSSPPPELQTPMKKIKSATPKRKTKAKQSLTPETEETDEDRINAKAIAAGRARYVADKLAAEVKVKVKVEHPRHDEEDFDEESMGMNVDSGEDEGLTAVELIEKEVFGEGVEA
ncbi:hypothetical protein D6D02_01559 [Aureobasidium pullulans]|uniref:Uncharacterized protein n=1 Tax=Aureobasidium pullulans TaxID=5580 RepID=A0A4S9JDI1_AURPU|nr:hypothetical protein D6D24_02504 [Aureobasidium pullulans]THX99854.1 hypothetical protein D6D03_06882 [Aureobasidium pullulans]THY20837.1 hypothetical protein D6D02_01559 [Aureobasidium pullulans]